MVILKKPLSMSQADVNFSNYEEARSLILGETSLAEDALEFVLPAVHLISHQTKADMLKRLPQFLPVLASVDGQILGTVLFDLYMKSLTEDESKSISQYFK